MAALALSFAAAVTGVSGTQAEPTAPAAPAAALDAGRTPSPPPPTEAESAEETLCRLIETAASDQGLPVAFFTRLIWKESRFRSDAVSPKGAQGIAQFMPGTAAERGLDDPFDTTAAIPASARYLADLKVRFGNLGLAAAAYNAGADRVSDWLSDAATLPLETQDYVLSVTGVAADTWADPSADTTKGANDDGKDCLTLAAFLKTAPAAPGLDIATAHAPWGVQVAGNFSRARAVSTFLDMKKRFAGILGSVDPMIVAGRAEGRGTRTFYRVRVPAASREEGERVCGKLRAAGASCIVLKS